MNEEIKYCKFCDEEKPIKEFCKSGGFIKNICRECQNKKQKEIYHNSKKVKDLQQRIDKAIEFLENKKELNKMFGTITLSKDSQDELLEILGGKK